MCCSPAALPGQERRYEPRLPIHRREQVLDVDDPRLELDDDQGTSGGVPTDDVNGAALTKMIEAVLDQHFVAFGAQERHDDLCECRVITIQEPIELTCAPAGQ